MVMIRNQVAQATVTIEEMLALKQKAKEANLTVSNLIRALLKEKVLK